MTVVITVTLRSYRGSGRDRRSTPPAWLPIHTPGAQRADDSCLWNFRLRKARVPAMETVRTQFAANLRHHRDRAGLSQEALADICDLHRTEISLLERRKRSPRLETIVILARGLQLCLARGTARRDSLSRSAQAPRDHAPARYSALSRAQLAQLVEHFHGKEGVIGSSPMLGSEETSAERRPRSGWRSAPKPSASWLRAAAAIVRPVTSTNAVEVHRHASSPCHSYISPDSTVPASRAERVGHVVEADVHRDLVAVRVGEDEVGVDR